MTIIDRLQPDSGRYRKIGAWIRRFRRKPRHAADHLAMWRDLRLIVLAGLVLIGLFAAFSYIDQNAAAQARELPIGLKRFFGTITEFGKSEYFLVPFGTVLILATVLAGRVSRRIDLLLASISVKAMYLYVAIAITGIAANVIKGAIGRGRPIVGDHLKFNAFELSYAHASFPSGHATTAIAAAVAFGAVWPRARFWFWGIAIMIAVSRAVLAKHYVSDVLAGAVLGGAGAWIVLRYFAVRSLGFVVDTSGHIRPMPGPSWYRIRRAFGGRFWK